MKNNDSVKLNRFPSINDESYSPLNYEDNKPTLNKRMIKRSFRKSSIQSLNNSPKNNPAILKRDPIAIYQRS